MNIHPLEVKFSFNGNENILYPVILQSDNETILIDCGYAGFMPLRSIKKLEIEKIICYHGGVIEEDIQQRLQKLISKYTK